MSKIVLLFVFILSLAACVGPKIDYNEYYIVKENGVYWSRFVRATQKRAEIEVESADKKSFTILSNALYGKDKDYVYYKGVPIPLADVNSFSLITDTLTRDKNYVFLYGEVIPDADPASIEIVNDRYFDKYTKDKNSFYINHNKFKPCDENSLTINIGFLHTWAIDKSCVFYSGKKIAGADIASYVKLTGAYSKDKNRVYHENKVVVAADPNSFRIEHGIPKDKTNCYKHDVVIPCSTQTEEITNLSPNEIDDRASGLAREWRKDQDKKEMDAIKIIEKTASEIVKQYGSAVLTPDDVKNINLGSLEPGYSYRLINNVPDSINSFSPRFDVITYKVRSVDSRHVLFDVIHPKKYGYFQQVSTTNGHHVKSDYPNSTDNYPNGNCEYQTNPCDYVIQDDRAAAPIRINQTGKFSNGIWTYYRTLESGEVLIYVYIYDKLGLPIYMSRYKKGILYYEYKRAM